MKRIVHTAEAPQARGAYSQGVVWGDLLFVSGQLPLHPESGQVVEGGLEAQVVRVLENLDAILRAGGSSLNQVLKTTVYITDIAHWDDVNRIYGRFFTQEPPARAVVPVKELHFGALIEIEAVATTGAKEAST